jgi:hypothetical protein
MRKTQASSELLQRQRYCISTGQVSCCSGSTGPTGPAGAPGTGLCYGPVFSGNVSQTSTAPIGAGVTGAYGFQVVGTVLFKSNGTAWVKQTTPINYYFMDTSTVGPYPMYRVDDNDERPTEVANCDLIFDTTEGTLYTRDPSGWQAGISLIGPPGPAPSGASSNTTTGVTIPSTGAQQSISGISINPDIPSSVQVTATLTISAGAGEGVVYAVVNAISGMEFPYTANATRPITISFTQMFDISAGALPILISIYGKSTNSTAATVACTSSIIYNLT